MLIIGERINSSRKPIARAIEAHDQGFIQNEARIQAESGAHYIDVNAGTFMGEEADQLKWVIETVQQVTELPLCLDSADPRVIEAVIPLVKSPPMINSITLEAERLEIILPLAAEYKAKVIALCQAQDSLAHTTEAKVELAGHLVEKSVSAGVPLDDLYIDPLVFPLANDTQSALAALEAISRIMKDHPGVHTTCGLTNISYGLPKRKLVNRTFLITAIAFGLDAAILDPTDNKLYGALKTALMVMGQDNFCMDYITAFRQERLG
ncbi:MAG: dihydropteroate synthase [Deltaproteobacteria bacterium]|nr:dihydropteroate synthase [Deltaproteobacteria bacterium]